MKITASLLLSNNISNDIVVCFDRLFPCGLDSKDTVTIEAVLGLTHPACYEVMECILGGYENCSRQEGCEGCCLHMANEKEMAEYITHQLGE